MASIDERIVSMSFENARFEAGVAVTMGSLAKLDKAIAQIGRTNGLENIEGSANKVTLQGPMSALDKLKAKLGATSAGSIFSDMESAANRVTLQGPISALDKLKAKLGFSGAAQSFSDLENASNRVQFSGPSSALDRLKAKLGFSEAPAAFSNLDSASNRAQFSGPSSALDRLKAKLGFPEASAAFSGLETESNRVTFEGVSRAIEGVNGKFSTMGLAAAVALGNIASKAVESGLEFAKSFAIGPLVDGFHDWETQIGAIQTIMANTGRSGAEGLGQVNSVLKDMQNYANLTVYNFSEMSKAIGTFTAAGVDLKTAQESIKGIANLAALSGSNSRQAESAMYQLSQAIAAGKVQLQDWNSVVYAGIGGHVLQEALFNTGKAMGTLKNVPLGETFDQWTKAGNTFRGSLTQNQEAAHGATAAASQMAQAQADAARTISDAERNAADSVTAAAKRVKDAQQGVGDAARQAATAVSNALDGVKSAQQGAADSARQASRDISNALDGVRTAQTSLADANRQASKDISDAVSQENDTIKQSAQNVATALDGVRVARQKLAEAMKPPSKDELQAASDKLRTSQLDQADLADAVALAQEQQSRATQDLALAQQSLSKLQSTPGTTAAQMIQAQRAVEDAQQKVKDLTDAQTRAYLQQRAATRAVDQAQSDLQATREKGTKRDQAVKQAQDALTKALTAYKDAQVKSSNDIAKAEQNVRDVKVKSAQAQQQAEQSLTKAEQNLSDVRIKSAENVQRSQDAVVKAERNLRDVRISSAESQRKAQEQLSQAEQDQARTAITAQESVARAHEQAAQKIEAAGQSISGGTGGRGMNTWLTSGVLTNTLKQFSGDVTTAQLKAQGFTDAQIKHIEAMGKVAVNSATQVKTFSQLTQSLKEEVGTAWQSVFTTLFGNIFQSTKLFSGLHTSIENALVGPIYQFNSVLKDWAAKGGRIQLIEGLKSGFKDLMAILNPIKQAFKDIFPPATGNTLLTLTNHFRTLMDHLRASPATMNNIRRTFDGFFAVLHIGWTIIKDVVGIFAHLLGATSGVGGGFLAITARVGDFLKRLDDAVKKEGIIKGLFGGLITTLSHPIELLKKIGEAIGSLFSGKNFGGVGSALKPLSGILDVASKAWKGFLNIVNEVKDKLKPLFGDVGKVVGNFIHQVATDIKTSNFGDVFNALNTGLLAGILLAFKKLFSKGLSVDVGGGMLKSITSLFKGLTESLEKMQQNIQAHTLLAIAGAIGILAAAILVLSTINPTKLASAMTAIAIGMGELVAAMVVLNKGLGGFAFARLPFIAASLIGLSIAMIFLGGAMKVFATMSWGDIAKGLAGVAFGLDAISLGTRSMNGPKVLATGAALIPLGLGLIILGGAMKIFATMSWEQMGKGLVGVAFGLDAIALGLRGMPKGLAVTAAGLIGIGVALVIISGAISSFGHMNLGTIAKGLIATAGSLVIIAEAMWRFPPGPALALQAASLLIVSFALTSLGISLRVMGSMKVDTIAKGLITMAGALAILAVGLEAMSGTLEGSAALFVAASAFAVLGPAIAFLGNLAIGTIVKGILAMGLAIGVLAVAGGLAAEPLTLLGIAMLAIGVGLTAIGAGVYLIGKGMSLVSDTGIKAVAVLVAGITAFIVAIPSMVINFVKGLVSILGEIVKLAPQIVTGLVKIIGDVLTGIGQLAPKIAKTIGILVAAIIRVIDQNAGGIIGAGTRLLIHLLDGIASHIGQVIKSAANVIINFLNALASKAPDIVKAGAHLLVKYLEGVANNIRSVINAGAHVIVKFLDGIASAIPNIIRSGAHVVVNIIKGIGNADIQIVRAAISVAGKFIAQLGRSMLGLINTGFHALINFLNGLADAINKNQRQLWDAGWRIAFSIIRGIVEGLASAPRHFWEIAKNIPGWIADGLLAHSPARLMYPIGEMIVQGMAVGMQLSKATLTSASKVLADHVIAETTTAFGQIPAALGDVMDIQPKITPVLDLSGVKKDAPTLAALLGGPVITARVSSDQAAAISDQQSALAAISVAQPTSPTFKFEQNNYSPDPLPAIEIYRQTNNQLSQLKSLVGV